MPSITALYWQQQQSGKRLLRYDPRAAGLSVPALVYTMSIP
jgi:hypothetical protein